MARHIRRWTDTLFLAINTISARLHSCPDWFRCHATKWPGFREIGNSVPPLLGRAVAGEILKALGGIAEKPEQPLLLGQGDEGLLNFDMSEAAACFGVPANTIVDKNFCDKNHIGFVGWVRP